MGATAPLTEEQKQEQEDIKDKILWNFTEQAKHPGHTRGVLFSNKPKAERALAYAKQQYPDFQWTLINRVLFPVQPKMKAVAVDTAQLVQDMTERYTTFDTSVMSFCASSHQAQQLLEACKQHAVLSVDLKLWREENVVYGKKR